MESFENGDSLYLCGRAKTEAFKYDDVMPRFKGRFSAHTIQKRYVWTQVILNTKEKNLRFRKYPATCRRGLRNELSLPHPTPPPPPPLQFYSHSVLN